MTLTQERKGELFIFFEAVLWGLFPVITILSLNSLSPLVSLGWSTLFAALFFAVVLSVKKKWHEIKNVPALKNILWATFFIGITYYLLSFFGLRYTSAGNASIISLTEVFFSYLFFQVWRKDSMPVWHVIGAILVIAGALIVLYPNVTQFRLGDILILGAALVAPFGNFFQQKARKIVDAATIMFVRSLISTFIIFILAYLFKADPFHFNLKGALLFLVINGVLLLGLSKILWIEGIHRISVTKSNALSGISPLIALLSAWVFLHNLPTIWQLLSFIPMGLGVVLLGASDNNHRGLDKKDRIAKM